MVFSDFSTLKKILKKDLSSLPKIKAALLGDSATQFLATAIKGVGAQRGFNVDLFEADFNQVERQILDASSELYEFAPDYTIIFQSTHKLLSKYGKLPPEKYAALADERLDFVRSALANIKGKIIYFNYPEIDDEVFGNYANKIQNSFVYQIRKLNFKLMNLASLSNNLHICDLSGIQNKLGRDFIFKPSIYVNSEMLLSIDAVPAVASRAFDIISSLAGKSKKCVILDLDNTLWGGIIGDDGLENIQLGSLGIGKAFSEFQLYLKKLKNRGIILAVCSKNTESVAKEPFEKHPDMVLRLEDISVFVANWDNKADNIRHIQKILNIGFDSMVFLDDNPFERNIVRENLPAITVPELPEDPAEYLEYLYNFNLFETASYSENDAERTKQYQVEAQRAEAQKSFTNESDFLKNLNMLSDVQPFNKFNTPRVAQLSQRSNQFNLRTVRYDEADIARIAADPSYASFSFTLEDKFGDNGMICALILKKQDDKTLFIDTWFMSCRVLKRGMENFTLNTIVNYAKENGFSKITGEYIPTAKNKLVENHYANLGFLNVDAAGRMLFELDVLAYVPKECHIQKK